MTPTSDAFRAEILALEPALQSYAARLAADEVEAEQLVRLTLDAALDGEATPPEDADADKRVWLFGILRGVFHSVARRRSMHRERGSAGRMWQPDRAEAFASPAVEVG